MTDNQREHHLARAEPGDVIEVRGLPGAPSRRGVIVELMGEPGHEHYRVRWDEIHESLFFPEAGEGVHVLHPKRGNYGRRHGPAPDAPAGTPA